MYYLKCNNCNHFNELKSEYLVFCNKCDKKLDNNFGIWKKWNPDMSFKDFKQQVCLSESDIQQLSIVHKPKSNKIKYVVITLLTIAFFYLVGKYGGELVSRLILSQGTSDKILQQEWVKETYGSFGLTVETPSKMLKEDIPLDEEVLEYIEIMDSYEYSKDRGFKVLLNSVKYKPIVKEANLKGAADGSVNEMKVQAGVSEFTYTENSLDVDGINGLIQTGNYMKDKTKIEFVNTVFAKGQLFWQVLVAWQYEDDNGRIAANRVVESIGFD